MFNQISVKMKEYSKIIGDCTRNLNYFMCTGIRIKPVWKTAEQQSSELFASIAVIGQETRNFIRFSDQSSVLNLMIKGLGSILSILLDLSILMPGWHSG